MVARLSAQKAHEVAFAAFAKMLADCPTAVLLLIGTGPREQELRALAVDLGVAQRVRFLGVRDDVPDLLPGLDISCLSSVHEGVPLVLAESMAAAVPVVATGCGSVPDMVSDGVEGSSSASAITTPGRPADRPRRRPRSAAPTRRRRTRPGERRVRHRSHRTWLRALITEVVRGR